MIFDKGSYAPEDVSAVKLQATPEGARAFVTAGFGLSVHWGVYALNGRGEWVYFSEKIPWDVYRRRLAEFNPTRFNPPAGARATLHGKAISYQFSSVQQPARRQGELLLQLGDGRHAGLC
jgi:hypothetical protein